MKKHSEETDEESIEQVIAELGGHLVNIEELMLPSLEAKVRDVRQVCQEAYKVLSRLELRIERLSRRE
jgi:hypothetical protein